MAKIKIILWKYQKNSDGTFPLRLRITKDRKVTYISTGFSVKPSDWDGNEVRRSHPHYKRLNLLLSKKKMEAMGASLELETGEQDPSVRKIRNKLKSPGTGFFSFSYSFIEKYNNEQQMHTYVKYTGVLKKFSDYLSGRTPEFKDVDYTLLSGFITYLKSLGNGKSTVDSNMNKIRAIFNEAIKRNVVDRNLYPFFQLKVDKPVAAKKEKLDIEDIKKIRKLKLIENSNLWHTRNAFLFSFNCMGMRAGDIVTLKEGNVFGNSLKYTMKKSADPFIIELTPEAKRIVNYYRTGSPDAYLFPFMDKTKTGKPMFKRINGCVSLLNNNLKKITSLAGIEKKITTHVARHSWSNRAKNLGIPVSSIQDALGHESEKTTRQYLDSLSSETLSKINRKVVMGNK